MLFPVWSEIEEGALGYLPAPGVVGDIGVGERPDGPAVEALVLTHHLPAPLLLLGGTLLVGGWQTRTLNTSVLAGTDAPLTVPVPCVEEGRWGGGGDHRVGSRLAPALGARHRRAQHRWGPARLDGLPPERPGRRWSRVAASQDRLAAPSPTGSLEDAAEQVADRLADALLVLRPLPGQRGVVIGMAGRVVALQLFDRHDALLAWWDGLVAAAALDALGEAETATSSSAARRLARRLGGLQLHTAPGVGLAEEVAAAADGVVVEGTRLGDRLLHLIAYAA